MAMRCFAGRHETDSLLISELDQAKEHQLHVLRVAERTLALPPGRALFTFGSVQVVTREAYVIPKIEYAIRLFPQNILIAPEAGKMACASLRPSTDVHNEDGYGRASKFGL